MGTGMAAAPQGERPTRSRTVRRRGAAATPPAPSACRGAPRRWPRSARRSSTTSRPGTCPAAVIDEAEIVVSELVSNAIRHARPLADGNLRVHWKVKGGVVEVEVTDGGGDSTPRPAPRTIWAPSGRGLRIVRSLAHEWGVTEDRNGSTRVGLPRRPVPSPQPLSIRSPPQAIGLARMGKASRRRKGADHGSATTRVEPAPFVARPFQGLPGETDWVAMREILPAATATVTFAKGQAPEGAPAEVTVATVLPLAWPGLHRTDGTVLVGTQSGSISGDASPRPRDLPAGRRHRRAGHAHHQHARRHRRHPAAAGPARHLGARST